MKNTVKTFVTLFTGMVLGAALFSGGVAQAAEIFYKAIPSPNTVYLDGKKVDLPAFAINGSNYVKLRDVGELMGFNVYWQDGVQIDSTAPYTGVAPDSGKPAAPAVPETTQAPATVQAPASAPAPAASGQAYTISTDHWSREDFSQQANPSVFTGAYDRNLYNAMRQTLVDEGAWNGGPVAYCMVSKANYSAVKNLMGRLDGVFWYEQYVPANFTNYYKYLDYYAMSASMPDSYKAPFDFIQPVMEKVNGMASDWEKVEYLNDYLCSLLTYKKNTTAAIADIFSFHGAELQAACGTYARAFKFLCQAADIPCITITTATHGWNLVYVNGQWLHVDVSTNDANNQHVILLASTVANRTDTAPEATAFLKELLVPGSTK